MRHLTLFAFLLLIASAICQVTLPYDTEVLIQPGTNYLVNVNVGFKVGGIFTLQSSTCAYHLYHTSLSSSEYYYATLNSLNKTRYFEMIPTASGTTDTFTLIMSGLFCTSTVKITQKNLAIGDRPSEPKMIPFGVLYETTYTFLTFITTRFYIPSGYKAVGTIKSTSGECKLDFSYSGNTFMTRTVSSGGMETTIEIIPSVDGMTSAEISVMGTEKSVLCTAQYFIELKARSAMDKENTRASSSDSSNVGAILGGILGTLFGICCISTIIIIVLVVVFGTACCAVGVAGGAAAVGGATVIATEKNRTEATYL